MRSHRLRRLRASDIGYEIDHEYGHRRREPLESVTVVFFYAEVGLVPGACEAVIHLALLFDHYRLQGDRHCLAIALESEVLPCLAFHDVVSEFEEPPAWDDGETGNLDHFFWCLDLREAIAVTGAGNPATIDEYV